ncbi:Sucrose transport protein SUC4, partial [Cucurbita argyrosperma subsp. sororia]
MGSVFLTLGLSLMWLCGPVFGLFVQSLVGSHERSLHQPIRILCDWIGFFVVTLGLVRLDSLCLVCGFSSSLIPLPIAMLFVRKTKGRNRDSIKPREFKFLNCAKTAEGFNKNRVANAYFSPFIATGNVFGYATGSLMAGTGPPWFWTFSTSLAICGELYGGKPNEGQSYSSGVRMGAFGHDIPPHSIVSAALINFALLGAPLADQLFGGGNSPALALAALAAFASGLIAILALPRSTAQKPRTLT